MRVLVCGSRTWCDRQAIETVLSGLVHNEYLGKGCIDFRLVHGDCPSGADAIADKVAALFPAVVVERHPADWNTHGKRAGHIRNQEMADLGADLCVAFADGSLDSPVSSGTQSMINKAKTANIRVWVVRSA